MKSEAFEVPQDAPAAVAWLTSQPEELQEVFMAALLSFMGLRLWPVAG